MKFNIFNYSQQGAIGLKLDLKDLLILDWFQTFQPRMHKVIHDEEQYYWISYEKVIQDIPIIEITTPKGLYKRLQNLCEVGILKHHTKRTNGGPYSYYLITDMIAILLSPESSFATVPKVPLQSPESSQHKDSSIINSSIINSCNAEQGQFSQNESLKEEKPSLEIFEQEWWRCSQIGPNRGFTQEHVNLFWARYDALGESKKTLFPNWQSYLKEWVRGEKRFGLAVKSQNSPKIENKTPYVFENKKVKEIPLTPVQRKFLNALVATVNKRPGSITSFNWLKSNVELMEGASPKVMRFKVPDRYAELRLLNDYVTDRGSIKGGSGALLEEAMQIIFPTCKKFEVVREEGEYSE